MKKINSNLVMLILTVGIWISFLSIEWNCKSKLFKENLIKWIKLFMHLVLTLQMKFF